MALAGTLVASIPSPSSGAIHIGNLQLRMYGLMIALAVIAAVWLAGRRFEQKGIGTRDQMASIALWAVPAGVIGARLYHVVTDWELFRDDPIRMLYIWQGGLGIWGGVAAGVAVGAWRAKRMGLPLGLAMDAVTPALPLAQAIGRLGNWWNQELFGRPTTLPWGLEISPEHRPAGYEQYSTFHPTFLYEALWNLLLVVVLIWIDRKGWLRPGRLVLVYIAGYTFVRFFIEGLRIDNANKIAGLRVNEWVSAIIFLVAVLWLAIDIWVHRGEPRVAPAPAAGAPGDPAADEAGDESLPLDGMSVSPDETPTEADPTPDQVTAPSSPEGASATNRRRIASRGTPTDTCRVRCGRRWAGGVGGHGHGHGHGQATGPARYRRAMADDVVLFERRGPSPSSPSTVPSA